MVLVEKDGGGSPGIERMERSVLMVQPHGWCKVGLGIIVSVGQTQHTKIVAKDTKPCRAFQDGCYMSSVAQHTRRYVGRFRQVHVTVEQKQQVKTGPGLSRRDTNRNGVGVVFGGVFLETVAACHHHGQECHLGQTRGHLGQHTIHVVVTAVEDSHVTKGTTQIGPQRRYVPFHHFRILCPNQQDRHGNKREENLILQNLFVGPSRAYSTLRCHGRWRR